MIARATLLATVGLTLAAAAPSAGQIRSEVAAGVQFGMMQTPVDRGWILSTGFEIDGQDYIVEGAWHRRTVVDDLRFGDLPEDQGRETYRGRYLTLSAGVRSRDSGHTIAPFYQVLVGGLQAIHRTEYEWPESFDADARNAECGIWAGDEQLGTCLNVRYPEFREERNNGFLMQSGAGLDVRAGGRLKFRVVTDLLVFASREYVVVLPRVSARVVVEFGR